MRTARQLRRDLAMLLSRRLDLSLAPPDRVSVNLTLRCNLSCAMCTTCYDSPELSTDEVKGIIDQTAAWGVEVFNPLGGEPFMRADIEELLAYAVRRGFYVTVTTNGTLITERRARAIAAVPSDRLHLIFSLDGDQTSHDRVRGEATWARAVAGYQRVRDADARAGNARRKILANTILHRGNLAVFPSVLDEQARLGLDGVQVLNLFRDDAEDKARAHDMWFRPEDMPALRTLTHALARRAEHPPAAGYRIQNTPAELRHIPAYYTEQLRPLDAPCWAGWKELYINADGAAIMCDGQLDFLNGRFGDVRRQTLREIWRSPALRHRRRVVKACTTPCIQTCYLRPESDHARELVRDAAELALGAARGRLGRLRARVEEVPGVLRLELTDVCPCDWRGCETPASRWRSLTRAAPEPPTRQSWARLRDRGYIDFGRGFMGFEVVRHVVADLLSARLRFQVLDLRWRGEPLLHPEILPILRFLLDRVAQDGLAGRLRVHTDGRLLTEELAALAGHAAPQEWVLDQDRAAGPLTEELAWLRASRGPATRLVMAVTASEAQEYSVPSGFTPAAGILPPGGDIFWVRRADHHHFQTDARAQDALQRAAQGLGVPVVDAGPEGCRLHQPVISWDGKVGLCPRDLTLEQRVGEVTPGSFAALWRGDGWARRRRSVAARGAPDLPSCLGCGTPRSPNRDY